MKKQIMIGIGTCVLLQLSQGCCKPNTQPPPPPPPINHSITYLTTNGYSIPATEKGQILEWRLAPTSAKASFKVKFEGLDPCGKHSKIEGDNDHPARCLVTTDAKGPRYISYLYSVVVTLADADREEVAPVDIPWQVVPCRNCNSVAGPVTPPPGGGVQYTGTGKGIEVTPLQPTSLPGLIKISCVDGKPTLDQPNASLTAGQNFQWELEGLADSDWTVTFDAASSPCGRTSVFTSVLARGNQDTCSVPASQTPQSYSYNLQVTGCPTTTPNNFTVIILAPNP